MSSSVAEFYFFWLLHDTKPSISLIKSLCEERYLSISQSNLPFYDSTKNVYFRSGYKEKTFSFIAFAKNMSWTFKLKTAFRLNDNTTALNTNNNYETDQPISGRWQDLFIVKKEMKICQIDWYGCSNRPQCKTWRRKNLMKSWIVF